MQKCHSVLKIAAALVCGHILDLTSCVQESLTSELGTAILDREQRSFGEWVHSRITSTQQLKGRVHCSELDSQL